jgi:hypothetical protein
MARSSRGGPHLSHFVIRQAIPAADHGSVSWVAGWTCRSCGADNTGSIDFCDRCDTFRWVDEAETLPGADGPVTESTADVDMRRPVVAELGAPTNPAPEAGSAGTWVTPAVAAAGPAPTVHHLGGGAALVARPPEVADGLGLGDTWVSPLDPDGRPVVTPSPRGLQEMVRPAPALGAAADAGPGALQCWRCGREALPGQRFCRCSAMVVVEPATPQARSFRPGSTKDLRGFRASIRAAAGGRPRFDRPLSSRVVLIRAVGVLAVILLVFSQFTQLGISGREWLVDRVVESLSGVALPAQASPESIGSGFPAAGSRVPNGLEVIR